MSGPIDVPGRSRLTIALTTRSTTSLATVARTRGDRQPVAPQDEGDDGDDRTDDERAELLERPQHRVEDLRQVVDGVEQRLLPRQGPSRHATTRAPTSEHR